MGHIKGVKEAKSIRLCDSRGITAFCRHVRRHVQCQSRDLIFCVEGYWGHG